MNSLPPLRTVRDPGTPPPSSPTTSLKARSGTIAPALRPVHTAQESLDLPSFPVPAREFLAQLIGHQLLLKDEAIEFARKVGLRASQLTNRERTADALTGLGYLTPFVISRVLSGSVHGLVFGRYRVLDRLGSGSIGVVFLGEHLRMRHKVALKTMPVDDTIPPQLLERFEQEARALAKLDHPNIVKVYDLGTIPESGPGYPGMLYQAQEYVPGNDLENYVYANGQQPIAVACEWGRQIASALKACHTAGLIHRDIKPSNLLLTASKRIKLADFGLARDYASVQTPNRVLLGSLDFLAPEQVVEPATAGPPADVYSLGATLFWLLTGQLPYPDSSSQSEALENIRTKPPRRAREVCYDLPKELDQLLFRMLTRNPAERPTLPEVHRALLSEASPSPVAPTAAPIAIGVDVAVRESIRVLEDELQTTRDKLTLCRHGLTTILSAVAATSPGETVEHQKRVSRSFRLIAQHLAPKPQWPMMADPHFVEDCERAIAAHDLGLVVVGQGGHSLEVHTLIGDEMLASCAKESGNALPFLRVLRAVVRHHHEAYNGTGYPDHLAKDGIPAVARVAAVLIAYDDLRRGALGEAPLSHVEAARRIISQSGKLFDPDVVHAFEQCEAELDRHFWDILEPGMEPPPIQLVSDPHKATQARPTSLKTGLPLRRWGNNDSSRDQRPG